MFLDTVRIHFYGWQIVDSANYFITTTPNRVVFFIFIKNSIFDIIF